MNVQHIFILLEWFDLICCICCLVLLLGRIRNVSNGNSEWNVKTIELVNASIESLWKIEEKRCPSLRSSFRYVRLNFEFDCNHLRQLKWNLYVSSPANSIQKNKLICRQSISRSWKCVTWRRSWTIGMKRVTVALRRAITFVE